MTRFSATAAGLICLIFSLLPPALAQQSDRSLATDHGCFPWQDFSNGQCIAKPSPEPPPLPPGPAATAPPTVVAAPPLPEPPQAPPLPATAPPALMAAPPATGPETVVCDGGALSDGVCNCPAGFSLMPMDRGAGGVCVRSNAENCLGGRMTVGGKCLCEGQVTMSGETYLLEYSNGKCLPMRCPVTALLRDGKCGAPSAAEPEANPRRGSRDGSDSPDETSRHCGRGMVRTRSGNCVAARRQQPDAYRLYYRNHQFGVPN